jgi:archaellum component FlaC
MALQIMQTRYMNEREVKKQIEYQINTSDKLNGILKRLNNLTEQIEKLKKEVKRDGSKRGNRLGNNK